IDQFGHDPIQHDANVIDMEVLQQIIDNEQLSEEKRKLVVKLYLHFASNIKSVLKKLELPFEIFNDQNLLRFISSIIEQQPFFSINEMIKTRYVLSNNIMKNFDITFLPKNVQLSIAHANIYVKDSELDFAIYLYFNKL